jgi:hypothetical protein
VIEEHFVELLILPSMPFYMRTEVSVNLPEHVECRYLQAIFLTIKCSYRQFRLNKS